MVITLELPELLEQQLRTKAARKGLTLNRFIIQSLKNEGETFPDSSLSEAALLEKINLDLGIAPEVWDRYELLHSKMHSEEITTAEHTELLKLIDLIETANAERLEYLIALAHLRGVGVEKLMDDLGIHPKASAHE